jgi:lipopolysaccharide transport system ATP-binding protein
MSSDGSGAGNAISVEHLRKRYRIGPREPYGTLTGTLGRLLSPASWARSAPASEADADGWIWALDDVSFEVAEGEVIGVIGRNGSGKSTLLKILSRITEPTAGRARVRGRVGSLLEVGTGFHPELSGRENVFVNGAILGMRRAEIARKFDAIVAFAEVERFIDTPVKFYSSGMQMRLAFAVAAHLEPEILLVDEVLAVGDLAFQAKCLGKMDDVGREGRTVLFVSHQMNQIRRLCSRSLWLERGRLAGEGSTADVVTRYEASFVATSGAAPSAAPSSLGAEFLSWTLGETGSAVHVLDSFDPVVVRFTLRVDRPVANGHHGVHLWDREGRVVWGAGTDNLRLAPGLYDVVYRLESLPIRPGPYRWHVSLYDNDRFVNALDCVPELSVQTPPTGHRRDEWAGYLNLVFEREIRPLPASGRTARPLAASAADAV